MINLILIFELVFSLCFHINSQLDSMNRIHPFTYISDFYGSDLHHRCRELERLSYKIIKFQAHLCFHNSCKDQNLVPNYLKLKVSVDSVRIKRIVNRFQRQLVLAKIADIIGTLKNLRHLFHNASQDISYFLKDDEMQGLLDHISERSIRLSSKITKRHNDKLEKLGFRFPKKATNDMVKTFVKNCSRKTFTDDQLRILSLSPQFNLPKATNRNNHVFAAQIESTILSLDEHLREQARNKILSNPLPKPGTHKNLPTDYNKIIKALRTDDEICVVQADKGNVTVILNAEDYQSKMRDILSDDQTYKEVDVDPTSNVEKCLSTKLKSFFIPLTEENKLTYRFLLSTNGAAPMLYGLPKIHKPPKFPCRPIVDFNPSPLKNLSKYLDSHIAPLTGKMSSHLKNSTSLIEQISDIHLEPDEDLVSFDVVSLYSSIPYDLALSVCKEYIQKTPDFEDKLKMSLAHFIELLDFCLRNTYFVYENRFYLQIKGLPMGAAISVTVANLVMEFLEVKVFETHPNLEARFFKRYIDDILCAIKRILIEVLLEALNGFNKDIQFTVEHEVNGSISYLDSTITRSQDGKLSFTVYRKPTHSGRYLEFFSENPISHKRSVAASLFHRALAICSDATSYELEREIIMRDLQNNGYPKDFLIKTERNTKIRRQEKLQALMTTEDSRQQLSQTWEPKDRRVCLPYAKTWSENTARTLKQYDLELTHRPINKMRFLWGNHKSYLPSHKHMNAVYSIPCKDCELVYTGESNNALRRMKEHEADCRLNHKDNSALAMHAHNLNHTPDFLGHKILANDAFYITRKLSESYLIQNSQNSMNKHPGSLPSIYMTSELFRNYR
jgi:hypothetical protein